MGRIYKCQNCGYKHDVCLVQSYNGRPCPKCKSKRYREIIDRTFYPSIKLQNRSKKKTKTARLRLMLIRLPQNLLNHNI